MRYTQFLLFEITDRCNLAESHAELCPIGKPELYANVDTARRLTDDKIVDCVRIAYKQMGFRGLVGWHGYCEPMLEWPRISKLMDRIKEEVQEAKFVLWTNGEAMPQNLAGLGAFSQIWLTNYRGRNWAALRDHCRDLHVFAPAMDKRLADRTRGNISRCLRPFGAVMLDVFGNGRLCCMDWRGEVPLGNVWRDDFSTVARRALTARQALASQPMHETAPDPCRQCAYHINEMWVNYQPPAKAADVECKHLAAPLERRRVALCVMATGHYTRYLQGVINSARTYFCLGHELTLHVWSDIGAAAAGISGPGLVWHQADHMPWPGPTLYRYRRMAKAGDLLRKADYVFYVDADSMFVRPVGSELFGNLVAVRHFGYLDVNPAHLPFDRREKTRACVPRGKGARYYAGAFQGGCASIYMAAVDVMANAIDADKADGIVANWHDEAHWNKHLVDHPPDVVLSHDYTCPPQWRPETQRICIVNKNAAYMRRPV